jgi:hypothetical protein
MKKMGTRKEGGQAKLPRCDTRSSHVWYVVDKVVVGQVFPGYFSFPCQSSLHQMLCTLIASIFKAE